MVGAWFKALKSYNKESKNQTRSLKLFFAKPIIIRKFKKTLKKKNRLWTIIYRFNEKRLTTKKKRRSDVKKELNIILKHYKAYLKKFKFENFYTILQFYITYKGNGKTIYSIGTVEQDQKSFKKVFFKGIDEYGIKILKLGKRTYKDWLEYPDFIETSNRRLYFIALKTFEFKKTKRIDKK